MTTFLVAFANEVIQRKTFTSFESTTIEVIFWEVWLGRNRITFRRNPQAFGSNRSTFFVSFETLVHDKREKDQTLLDISISDILEEDIRILSVEP